jgi:transcriptional regulator with XRE-family HTH domain
MPQEFARMIDDRVARRIRERRLHVGMTQYELARILGVAFQQTHKYERGISRISAGRLFDIATALGTPVEYFFAADETIEMRRMEAGDDD